MKVVKIIMTIDLNKLADCRDALLLAEITCWLHMFGKLHKDFITGKDKDLDIKIPEEVKNKYKELNNLLIDPMWPSQIWQKFGIPELKVNTTIEKIINNHRNPNKAEGIVSLVCDTHGRGSSVEKSVLHQGGAYYNLYDQRNKQNEIYLSSVFGIENTINVNDIRNYELYNFLQDNLYMGQVTNEVLQKLPSEIDIKKLQFLVNNDFTRQTLSNRLKKCNFSNKHINIILSYIQKSNRLNLISKEDWIEFRSNFIKHLTIFFRSNIADTRRPINETTIFDQTVLSVAFLKASLAEILLSTWKEPNPKNDKDKYQWRILKVGFDIMEFYSRSFSYADMLARKVLIKTAFNEVRNLLETEYPLGYELYHDEKGSIFIMPDINAMLDTQINGLTIEKKIKEIFSRSLEGEAEVILISPAEPSRNMLLFGKLAKEKIPKPAPKQTWLSKQWKDINSRQICTVCGYRHQVDKERALCDICKYRRQDRAQKWLKNLDGTIWMDEIADKNGKIALITGQFNLNYWLSGELISSITVGDPQKDVNYLRLKSEIINNFNKEIKQINYLYQLLPKHIIKKFKIVKDLYKFLIEDSDLKINANTDNNIKASLLALSLIRQQPSPARIYRVWETTKRFWEDINDEFKNTVKENPPRLLLFPEHTDNIINHHSSYACELLIDNKKISAFWYGEQKHFIIIENLEYIKKSQKLEKDIKEFIKDYKNNIIIQEPSDYGKKINTLGYFTIKQVEESNQYIPAIPILSEPGTFMALVPADRVMNIINSIKEKYEQEMGKVRNRLPLNLGVVFSSSKTPLRVILDSGKRMLKEKEFSKTFELINDAKPLSDKQSLPEHLKNDKHWEEFIKVELKIIEDTKRQNLHNIQNKNRNINWHVPLKMGDGTTDDVWYPYVFVKSDKDGNPPLSRGKLYEAPCPWNNNRPEWVLHAKDLKEGDKIYFAPSTFDYQWLDTGGRRFEIAYDGNGQRFDMPQRPYLLDELDKLQDIWKALVNHLTTTQIHSLRELIETKRQEWDVYQNDDVFRQFCRDAIAMAQWKKSDDKYPWEKENKKFKEWIDIMTDYTVKGWLNDVIEINMQILKRKPEQGG